jgi:ketosteroid isomerase-like protein
MMMSTWRILMGLVVMSVLASGQDTNRSEHGDRTLLIALENSWNQAQLHHDSKALDGLVADTFISTDNDGGFQNKAQFLADNRDTSYAPTVMTNSDERVFFYDNTAVVAGVYHAKGTSKGKPFDHYGRFTDTWVFTKSKWLCVASHTSSLKK